MSSSLKGDLELSCEVTPASAAVVWRKDQVEITEDQRTAFVSKGTQRKLIIKSAKKSDEGHYSCETATDKVTFQVKIKGTTVKLCFFVVLFNNSLRRYTFLYFICFLRKSGPSCLLQQGVCPEGGESYSLPESHS